MESNMGQALAEVYDIIQHLDESDKTKISKNMIEFLDNHKDSTYEVKIDYSKSIVDQDILQETRAILSILYRDYLCSKEEKEVLKRIESFEMAMQDEEKHKKYEVKFDEKPIISTEKSEENSLIKKEKWYEKIICYIKKIFK